MRVDHALEEGEAIRHYDSMVAKLVAHGADREEARLGLLRAVEGACCWACRRIRPSGGLPGQPGIRGWRCPHRLCRNSYAGRAAGDGAAVAVAASAALVAAGVLDGGGKPAALARAAASVALDGGRNNRCRRSCVAGRDGWHVSLRQRDGDATAEECVLRVLRTDAAAGARWSSASGVAYPLVFAADKHALHLFQSWPRVEIPAP
ncbi:hypothetical protein ACTMU2_20265 [Cupriavidus basilensis]